MVDGGKLRNSGREKYYAEIPIRVKDNINCDRKELKERAKIAIEILNFCSASEEEQSEENLKALIIEMMRMKPHLFTSAAEEAGISNYRKDAVTRSRSESTIAVEDS